MNLLRILYPNAYRARSFTEIKFIYEYYHIGIRRVIELEDFVGLLYLIETSYMNFYNNDPTIIRFMIYQSIIKLEI